MNRAPVNALICLDSWLPPTALDADLGYSLGAFRIGVGLIALRVGANLTKKVLFTKNFLIKSQIFNIITQSMCLKCKNRV